MRIIIFLLLWTVFSLKYLANGTEADLSLLTSDQAQVWLKAVSEINNKTQSPNIEIIHWGKNIEISLYNDPPNDATLRTRNLFKQNINKRVDYYLYENELNPSPPLNIYDKCHGQLTSKYAGRESAGIYVFTSNQASYALGIIIVETMNSFQWFNGTSFFSFTDETSLQNGTKLLLGFETILYYNSNSDLRNYNEKTNKIIEQANITIDYTKINNNLENFLFMEDLSCQRHQRIVDDALRSVIFACTVQVTFKCPLKAGSTCWLENKQISNIHLMINLSTFTNVRALSTRIDV